MDKQGFDWPVKPMEPVTRKEVFDSADTVFQVKWDGVRVLSYVFADKSIRLYNRRLNERTLQYPEVSQALSKLEPLTVLDGEIVALGANGKPDFPLVLQRDLMRMPSKIRYTASRIPVYYMVFDILWLDGKAVFKLPMSERLLILEKMDFGQSVMQHVDSTKGAGKALFEAVRAEGLEGIVAKKMDSPYHIGKKTDTWQKIKCLRQLEAAVGGYIAEGKRFKSLLLGIPHASGLLYIGAAASGVTQKQWNALGSVFADSCWPCPFVNPPDTAGARWVLPKVHVSVRFLEYTKSGLMRAPAIAGFLEKI